MPVFGGLRTGAAPKSNTVNAKAIGTILPIEVIGASSKRDWSQLEFVPLKRFSEVRETFREVVQRPQRL
jgi:hypothetical protein